MCETCRVLTARNEELQARVADLERNVYNTDWQAPADLHLSGAEEVLVRVMLRCGDRVSPKELLLEATRLAPGAIRENPELKLVDVQICKLRGKLRRAHLEIETVWGRGYRLPRETRTRLLNWNTEAKAA